MTRLLTAIVPIIWGTTYIVTTDVLPPGRPLLAGLMRALPAGLLLLLIFRRLPYGAWWYKSAALGAANIGGFFAFLFLAAYLLPGGVASIVTNTAPLWVIALSPIMLGTSMKLRQIIGAGIAVLGVGALVLTPSSHLNMAGVAAGLAASVCMATGIVLAKKWGKPEGTPLLAVTGWQLTLGGLLLLPPMLLIEGVPESLTAANWAGYAYLTIFGALIAYGLWFNGIAKLDVVQVAILSVLSPVTATLLGVVVKGEELSAVQWAGVAAVLVALVAVQTEGMGKRAAARRG
ncbi:MAG TPA: EamA family transporter [Candidatus Corynebacterium gallistercoris]|uniref:EamA family transporter n=1 Tax=Candidatus Corynebacterium gallistercoris TaxID=2838530 RepID=A0A9D1RXQ7_9CORY|nr:EamA family transporter [Candidatus Corynebacterium gallistercoris]